MTDDLGWRKDFNESQHGQIEETKTKWKSSEFWLAITLTFMLTVAACMSGIYIWLTIFHEHVPSYYVAALKEKDALNQQLKRAIKTYEQKLAQRTAAAQPPSKPTPEFDRAKQVELAGIRKGDGAENSFIRQLEGAPKYFGFTGDPENQKALKKWADRYAHLIAIYTGFYDWRFGAEVRFRQVGIVLLLEKGPHGNIFVTEYDNSSVAVTRTAGAVMSNGGLARKLPSMRKFLGSGGGRNLPPHTYLYTGIGGTG